MKTPRAFFIAFISACSVFTDGSEWIQEENFRWRELSKIERNGVGFKLLRAADTGVHFTNVISEIAIARNRVLEIGAGAAIGDYDGDGLPDIFACGIESAARLYRNRGDWKFDDQTGAAGLPTNFTNARGAVFADLNGDGQMDLLVSTVLIGVRCFLGANGKFIESTAASGLQRPSGATTLALADVDGNGTLDLYVTNYRTNDIRDVGRLAIKSVGGKPIIPPELQSRFTVRRGDVVELGEPDQLYLNDGNAHFTPVSWTAGAFVDSDGKPLRGPPRDWGLTATFRDVNGDGAPDIYVCNDYWTPDRFWINDGKGHFRAAPPFATRKMPFSSMGVDFADVNRDGVLDFFCAEMLASHPRDRKRQMFAEKLLASPIGISDQIMQVFQNTLFLGRGDGTYTEAACYAGLEATDWSWSPLFIDVDLDGFEDLLISVGHFHDVQDLDADRAIRKRQHSWSGYTNEVVRQERFTQELLENYRLYPPLDLTVRAFRNGGDLRFKDVSAEWGFTDASVHHGMALGDMDGDGDLDVVINCMNSGLKIYRNESAGSRVAVRLKGLPPNTTGVGSRIALRSDLVQQKEITAGGSYISGSDAVAVFAFRPSATLEVTWRSGKISVVSEIRPNRLYEITEPRDAPIAQSPSKRVSPPIFEDVSDRINHTHLQNDFDDFQRQPTLPFKLSQRGPACAWLDVNGDGHDDLVISDAIGSVTFYCDGAGNFRRATNAVSSSLLPKPMNFVATALGSFAPPAGMALFVAGDILPGRYPLAQPPSFFRLDRGQWVVDSTNTTALAPVGIVNAAVWSDLDGDGLPELVLACEWGPIRVFASRGGALKEVTAEYGLSEFTGLWRGIATVDVDGDGRLDIIAANWGLNSQWRASREKPFTAFFGDFAQAGRVEFIETEWDSSASTLTARRPIERLASAMPFLLEKFGSFKQIADAPIAQLLGDKYSSAKQVSVITLASTVFLNRGGKFEAIELPTEAQLAPASSVSAADFDGDGHIDVFLAQNFIAMHPDYPPQDSGCGLLLRGDGSGRFKAMSGDESGIKIYGEQRAAAVCDFDSDGRPDLAVTQNGAQTKLYRNTRR